MLSVSCQRVGYRFAVAADIKERRASIDIQNAECYQYSEREGVRSCRIFDTCFKGNLCPILLLDYSVVLGLICKLAVGV